MSPDSFVLLVDRNNLVDSTVIQLGHSKRTSRNHSEYDSSLCWYGSVEYFEFFSSLNEGSGVIVNMMFHNKNGYEIGLTSIHFVVFFHFFVLLDRMSEVGFDVFGLDQL